MRAHNAQTRARAAAKAKSLRKIAARRISRMRIMRRRVQAGMVARGLCEEKISTKMPPGGVFEVKTSEQHKLEKSVLLARSESQKVDGGLRGGEQSRATRARRVADELKALALKALRRQERVFGYVSMSPTTSRRRSERENGAYFSKHARRRGKKRCARQSPK